MTALPSEFFVNTKRSTRVLQVDASKIGQYIFEDAERSFLGHWKIQLSDSSVDAANLQEAATLLQQSDIPVAFPTETVYGLAADATRPLAVRGIYNAKRRPSDNPLIVHISSLSQLRNLFSTPNFSYPSSSFNKDPIPKIYHPLIANFWPGPLTILLPLPVPSPLAAEVTNSLPTFAVRMPASRLALAFIHLAGKPLAAPSANASSKPSPTTAAHVLHDLSGRIDLILDGGPCEVGVESTVVDGLVKPPVILRPGGVSIDMLRDTPGWEDVRIAYTDEAEKGQPRAPGMKYKHYSPNARVLLFHGEMNAEVARKHLQESRSLGLLTTQNWKAEDLGIRPQPHRANPVLDLNGHSVYPDGSTDHNQQKTIASPIPVETLGDALLQPMPYAQHSQLEYGDQREDTVDVWTIELGQDSMAMARGLFSALRELDQKGVEVVFVEGIEDREDGARAAVMNRLRKAAESEIQI